LLKVNGRSDVTKFKFFASKRMNIENLDDAKLYKRVMDSFQTMNFKKEEQAAVLQVTAAVLWLGNVDFDESTRSESKYNFPF
jgi:myosin heavy subunit